MTWKELKNNIACWACSNHARDLPMPVGRRPAVACSTALLSVTTSACISFRFPLAARNLRPTDLQRPGSGEWGVQTVAMAHSAPSGSWFQWQEQERNLRKNNAYLRKVAKALRILSCKLFSYQKSAGCAAHLGNPQHIAILSLQRLARTIRKGKRARDIMRSGEQRRTPRAHTHRARRAPTTTICSLC